MFAIAKHPTVRHVPINNSDIKIIQSESKILLISFFFIIICYKPCNVLVFIYT